MPSRNRHLDALAPAVRSLVQRRIDEHAERQATLDGTLDQVLADVDAAADGRCSCGCNVAITPDSPSAYYATAACQRRWMAGQVDNPGEVYNRPDAADYPCVDSGIQTLNEPGVDLLAPRPLHHPPGRAVDIPPDLSHLLGRSEVGIDHRGHVHVSWTPPPARQRQLIYGPGRFDEVFAYRCTCPNCDDFMEPLIYDVFGVGDRAFDVDHRVCIGGPVWEQECSSCHTAMLGVVHVPMLQPAQNPAGWLLELHTTYGRVRSTVSSLALGRLRDDEARGVFVTGTWTSMERDLARFEREWRGRWARCEAAMYEWAQTGMLAAIPEAVPEAVRRIIGDGLT